MNDPSSSMMMQGGGAGELSMMQDNNMVVAVRIRPLSTKEEAAGHQKCCKVLRNKVRT